jgi:hypothetical protein
MLNTTVKNSKETERSYIQCGPSSRQRESQKHSPQKKLESVLAAWFKQACEGNVSMDDTHLKEKALHIANYLGISIFSASNGWIDRFKRKDHIVYRTLSGESRSVHPETVEDSKNY